ncbi:ABC transporter permease [Mesorhizobium sp. M0088]|uniref:ABC transporter permease n=1 Tax=Mesorhizobium sp. M0088 TaxID=2956873 RepID=UPI0033386490
MDITLFLASILEQATPILLAALAAMITMRANILNIAIEGMMLVAAFAAIVVGQATDSAGLAIVAAIGAGVGMSLVFAFVAIVLRADFIVAGIGLNILAAGGTLFLLEQVYQDPGGLRPDAFPDLWRLPYNPLFAIPYIGPALEQQSIVVFAALAAIPLSAFVLYRTPFGYALRAVGESEHAAVAAGVSVPRIKISAILASGLLAGLAGAQLSMDKLHFFIPDMTSGRGFLGLAATLFGGSLPWGTAGAAFLFGTFGALGDRLQSFQIPPQFVLMAPYIAAIAGIVITRLRGVMRERPAPIKGNVDHDSDAARRTLHQLAAYDPETGPHAATASGRAEPESMLSARKFTNTRTLGVT